VPRSRVCACLDSPRPCYLRAELKRTGLTRWSLRVAVVVVIILVIFFAVAFVFVFLFLLVFIFLVWRLSKEDIGSHRPISRA
jgi:hypothetical protein